MFLDTIKRLCTPAYVYLVISLVTITLIMIQNAGNTNRYCLGYFECAVPSTAMMYAFQLFYVAFWTFVLNCICKAGFKQISWLIVLLPYILFFVLIGIVFLHQGVSV